MYYSEHRKIAYSHCPSQILFNKANEKALKGEKMEKGYAMIKEGRRIDDASDHPLVSGPSLG
jgi:hypothetical protein